MTTDDRRTPRPADEARGAPGHPAGAPAVLRAEDLDRAQLAVLVREYLLGGQLIDRAGMPHAISAHGRDVMGEIAIEEWMGASPIYTRRTQRLLDFRGEDVETIFKGMQFDIGAPPEFLDFRYRVHGPEHGEFWLDHCGALMDVEPMGDDYVHTMCHTIEDPTFDATACATNARARMTPRHRPPRSPADRHPHCHWDVHIVADADPVPEPEPAIRLATTRLASLPLAEIRPEHDEQGWHDYRAPLDPDLRTEQFSRSALLALRDEVALQGHLLVTSFLHAVERRSSVEAAVEMGVHQFTGVAGVVAGRLRDALGLGTSLGDIATVLELHPAFAPRSYVDWEVRHDPGAAGGAGELTVHLGDCEALHETGFENWISILHTGQADVALDAIVQAVDPGARCVPRRADDGAVASWTVELGHEPASEHADVTLTRFSSGAGFEFTETPVTLA